MGLSRNRAKMFKSLITPEEALSTILSHAEKLKLHAALKPISMAHGLMSAETTLAKISYPPFDRALADGYAVRSFDTFEASDADPRGIRVVGEVKVGAKPNIPIAAGECVEIHTGAPLPFGADAVIKREEVLEENGRILIRKPITPWENVAVAGADVMPYELILPRGRRMGPHELALLASMGIAEVRVYEEVRAAIISIGDELLSPLVKLEEGKVYDANTYSLSALVKESGGRVVHVDLIRDDEGELTSSLRRALNAADVIIISGGSSVGPADLVPRTLSSMGKIIFHGLNIKPGKPTLFAIVEGKPVFGLPGFPISAIVAFNLLVRPLIRKLCGYSDAPSGIGGRLAKGILSDGRRTYVPVAVMRQEGEFVARPLSADSGAAITLSRSDGFAIIPERTVYAREGELVELQLYSEPSRDRLIISGSYFEGCGVIADSLLDVGLDPLILRSSSSSGIVEVMEGESHLACVHLINDGMGFNEHLLEEYGELVLIVGFRREVGLITMPGNPKGICSIGDLTKPNVTFVNRIRGSATRLIIDKMLEALSAREGISASSMRSCIMWYDMEFPTHVSAALRVRWGEADATIGLMSIANALGLHFIPLIDERVDFLVRKDMLEDRKLKCLLNVIGSERVKRRSSEIPGIRASEHTGHILHSGWEAKHSLRR